MEEKERRARFNMAISEFGQRGAKQRPTKPTSPRWGGNILIKPPRLLELKWPQVEKRAKLWKKKWGGLGGKTPNVNYFFAILEICTSITLV